MNSNRNSYRISLWWSWRETTLALKRETLVHEGEQKVSQGLYKFNSRFRCWERREAGRVGGKKDATDLRDPLLFATQQGEFPKEF
jgi:hypothetical protein